MRATPKEQPQNAVMSEDTCQRCLEPSPCPTEIVSSQWRHSHNYRHHVFTNVIGVDDDVGYTIPRVTRDQPWKSYNIGNLLFNTILALGFEWGISLQPIEFSKIFKGGSDREITLLQMREFSAKAGTQVVKDYVAFPSRGIARWCLGRPGWRDDLRHGLATARSADPMSHAGVVPFTDHQCLLGA
jgi:hypothetical protein